MSIKSTTLKLPKNVHLLVQQKVIADGLGMRGKSDWVRDAIELFLQRSDYPELVEIASDVVSLDDTISLRLSEEVIGKIDQAVLTVRQKYPLMEGVQSNIIRASIIQKLL